jgi:V/A-type H+-transporting ATPase subunit D
MTGTGQAPTRAAVLELMNEQVVVNEAYVFLDEKRLLLAAELLRQLRLYQQTSEELDDLHARVRAAMEAAIRSHGLNGIQVYPAGSIDAVEWAQTTRNFMGVTLVEAGFKGEGGNAVPTTAVNPSGAAELCRKLFRSILDKSAVLAGLSGNLYRLLSEYRVTERRSRALENIILPEIEQSLREMSSHLEELDLEDAIRVRLQSK